MRKKYKNKWLLEIKENIDINRKKQLEQRKIADEIWEYQLKQIRQGFDDMLICCNNSLQDTNKITLEGLAERLINSSFLDLEDQQHQKKVDLNNQANRNTVWTELRDLESRWWIKSDKIYADSLKLISQEIVGDIELNKFTSSPMDNKFDVFSQPSTSTTTETNYIQLIDLTFSPSPMDNKFDVFSQPSTSTTTETNYIQLIDLTFSPSPMDNTIFNFKADTPEVAEQILVQQAREEQHQIWKESKFSSRANTSPTSKRTKKKKITGSTKSKNHW